MATIQSTIHFGHGIFTLEDGQIIKADKLSETDKWTSVKTDEHKFGRTSRLDLSVHLAVW